MTRLKSSFVPLFCVCSNWFMEASHRGVEDKKRILQEDNSKEEEQPKRIRQIQHVDGTWPSFAYILGIFTEETGDL